MTNGAGSSDLLQTSERLPLERVSVIISCLDEEDTIEECLRRILEAVPAAEIVLVHGGHDRTADIGDRVAGDHPNLRVIRNENDRGKGHAIKVGITNASHDVMVQIDADLQFMPEDIPRVVGPLLRGEADVAFGCRFMEQSDRSQYEAKLFRDLGNRIVNGYISMLAGRQFLDVTTGLKSWTRRAMADIGFKDDGFVYEAEIAMRGALKGCRFAMVPIAYSKRLGGISGLGEGWNETLNIVTTGVKILFISTLIRLSLW